MPSVKVTTEKATTGSPGAAAAAQRMLRLPRTWVLVVAVVFVVIAPSIMGTWLPALMLLVAYAVGVVGFNLLMAAGQLSMGHAAFMGLGGFIYAYLASGDVARTSGLSWPPLLAALVALIVVGLIGLAFSPLTSRLGGLSLAAASLGLVFLADHIFGVATPVTGGAAGRPVPPLGIGDAVITSRPTLWYTLCIIAAVSFIFAALLVRSRVGRALYAIRDGELFAPAIGVEVRMFKAKAFFVSSIYAGLSGIMIGLIASSLVAEAFTLMLSLNILMMGILGGATYVVTGALAGSAVFVLLPEVLRRYSSAFPFLAPEGSTSGVTASAATSYIFGAAIILVLILRPDGLMSLGSSLSRRKKTPEASTTSQTDTD